MFLKKKRCLGSTEKGFRKGASQIYTSRQIPNQPDASIFKKQHHKALLMLDQQTSDCLNGGQSVHRNKACERDGTHINGRVVCTSFHAFCQHEEFFCRGFRRRLRFLPKEIVNCLCLRGVDGFFPSQK